MTTEVDENQEQSKTSDIQDHLNQLLAAEDDLAKNDEQHSASTQSAIHTPLSEEDGHEKTSWRQRIREGIQSFYSDEGERFHLPTPAELKALGQSVSGKGEWERPYISEMERQGLLTIGGLFIVAGILGFLVSPWGSVSTYHVQGNQEITTKKLLTELGLDKGQSGLLLLTEQRSLAHKAQALDPQIKDLKVTLKSPTTMQVQVTEIPSVGYVKDGQKYVPLLADGTRLTQDAQKWPEENFPVYSGFKSDQKMDEVLASFGTLSLALRQAVSEIIWSPTGENSSRLVFIMNDGNQVLANAENFETKFKYYPGMATQLKKNGVIDLQVGAYAKPY